jgi:non-specific serine/threonine protein kinase
MMAAWPRTSKRYGPNRQRLQPYNSGEPYIHESLEVLFAQHKPAKIDNEESAVLCSIMLQILECNPAKRPLAVDLLKHLWFLE